MRLLEELEALFAAFVRFELTLRRTARFPATLYLDPDPAERLSR